MTLNHNVCHKSNILFVIIVVQKFAENKQKKRKKLSNKFLINKSKNFFFVRSKTLRIKK